MMLIFFASRSRHTTCALETGVQTSALPILIACVQRADMFDQHVQVAQSGLVHALRQAGLGERASGAEGERVAVVGEYARIQAGEGRCHAGECSRRSEEHTSELQSLMRISYAVFCLKKTHRRQV